MSREEFFVGRFIAKRSLSTPSFKGAEEAERMADALALEPELKQFPEAQEMVRVHELGHALGDPEVEGFIFVDILTVGIVTRKQYRGLHFVLGGYIPEGRPRTYKEMVTIAKNVEDPSIIDKCGVFMYRFLKKGFKPDSK